MNSLLQKFRLRLLAVPLLSAATAVPCGFIPFSPAPVVCAVLAMSAAPSEALPVHGVARRTSRRTTRRVVRRHMFLLPGGATPFVFGPYRYYRVGGIYYYPYMMGGRTVYVEIDVDVSGNPMAPPPASQVQYEINLN